MKEHIYMTHGHGQQCEDSLSKWGRAWAEGDKGEKTETTLIA